MRLARDFALAKAGSNRAANMAMIAMTTNNSIRVKPLSNFLGCFDFSMGIPVNQASLC